MSSQEFLCNNADSVSPKTDEHTDNLEHLNSLPSTSKENISEQIFDEKVFENNEIEQFPLIPSSIIKSQLSKLVSQKIDENICHILTHHCSYKLAEIIRVAINYMKQCGRLKFTVDDFNKGLLFCGENPKDSSLPSGGQTAISTPKKRSRKKKDTAKDTKWFQNVYKKMHCVHIKEVWLNDISPLSASINDLPDELQDYFKVVTEMLFSNDEETNCVILSDLQTNKNIFQLVPHFVNFLNDALNKFQFDFLKVSMLLKVINVLLRNPNLYFGQDSYLNILSCALLKFLAVDLLHYDQGKDCWLLKDTAANILVLILKRSKYQHLFFETMYFMKSILMTFDNSLNSHYGVLVTLNSIGVPAILLLLPSYIYIFHEHVKMIPLSYNQRRVDVHMVKEQIARSYYILVNYYFKIECKNSDFKSAHHFNSKFFLPDYLKDITVFPVLSESFFSDYFGETLLPAFPSLNFVSHPTYLRKKKRKTIAKNKTRHNVV